MNWTLTENFPGQPGNEVWSVLGHFSFCSSIIWIWCFEPKKMVYFVPCTSLKWVHLTPWTCRFLLVTLLVAGQLCSTTRSLSQQHYRRTGAPAHRQGVSRGYTVSHGSDGSAGVQDHHTTGPGTASLVTLLYEMWSTDFVYPITRADLCLFLFYKFQWN